VSQFPDERGAELRELFFETSQELLQSLNEEALKLEKQPGDSETVRTIRRIVHTLKGDAAAAGFRELSELAHSLEDALALESAESHASLAEIAFHAADLFGNMVTAYQKNAKLPSNATLRKMVRELAKQPKAGKPAGKKTRASAALPTPAVWTEYERLEMQRAVGQGQGIFQLQVKIDPLCAMPIAARQLLLKALGEVGEVLASRPEAGSAEVTKQVDLLVASGKTGEQLSAKCRIPTIVSQVSVEAIEVASAETSLNSTVPAPPSDLPTPSPASSEAQRPSEPAPAALSHDDGGTPKHAPTAVENILRVDADRIDTVLNLVGELIIGKSMLQQALNELAKQHPKDAIRGRFADAMAFQSRVLGDLQRSVMKVRMVPVEQLFRRFPRMVRDVAKQCGKEVELVVSGQDTDLDKGLLDGIAEPLTHLVRNAVGHGIESAEERVRQGKPAVGTLRLDAYHQGNQVIVEVSDDGRGIDAQKVKARAVERGLVTAEEAKRLNENDILELIFRPGFSTADQITELSGRGVGLDVVQSVLQRLKGTVNIESRPGHGTTFRLQLPLTLAIIKALLFRVENRLYAIPLNSVAEISRAYEHELHQVDGREVLQLRNQVLPVIWLGRKAGQSPAESKAYQFGKIFVLVIDMGERKFGLLVNSLDGEEELVIKALDDQTVETDLVSGASILGDGRVVLILNLVAIVERFVKSRPDNVLSPAFGMLLSHADRAQTNNHPAGVQS
jgi:two-component system, chemotaxis family, sensor kinase CheA